MGQSESGSDPGSSAGPEPVLLEEPAILYIQASPSEIEQLRARTAPEDFFTIADDVMFYRSEAFSVVERASIPLVTRVGRIPVRFISDGQERVLDLSEVPWLVLIVLFKPGRDPLVLAPIDLSADTSVVSQYF
jgi:hypothetical protein